MQESDSGVDEDSGRKWSGEIFTFRTSTQLLIVRILTMTEDYDIILARDIPFFTYLSVCRAAVCLGVSLSEKPFRRKTGQKEPPLVLDQQDWVEATTASRLEWSNLGLLHPHGWRRLPQRKSWMRSAIDKLLATKEADAVNVGPWTLVLSRAAPLLLLLTLSFSLSPSLLWSRSQTGGAQRGGPCLGMCLRWCAFANTAVRREMRFHCSHYVAEEGGHVSLGVNAWLLGRAASPQRRRA